MEYTSSRSFKLLDLGAIFGVKNVQIMVLQRTKKKASQSFKRPHRHHQLQVFQALSDEPSLHHQKLHLFLPFLEYGHTHPATCARCENHGSVVKALMSQGSTCKERTRITIHHSSEKLLRYCEHYLASVLSFIMLA